MEKKLQKNLQRFLNKNKIDKKINFHSLKYENKFNLNKKIKQSKKKLCLFLN